MDIQLDNIYVINLEINIIILKAFLIIGMALFAALIIHLWRGGLVRRMNSDNAVVEVNMEQITALRKMEFACLGFALFVLLITLPLYTKKLKTSEVICEEMFENFQSEQQDGIALMGTTFRLKTEAYNKLGLCLANKGYQIRNINNEADSKGLYEIKKIK